MRRVNVVWFRPFNFFDVCLVFFPFPTRSVCVCLFVRASSLFGNGSLLMGTFWQSLFYVTIKSAG